MCLAVYVYVVHVSVYVNVSVWAESSSFSPWADKNNRTFAWSGAKLERNLTLVMCVSFTLSTAQKLLNWIGEKTSTFSILSTFFACYFFAALISLSHTITQETDDRLYCSIAAFSPPFSVSSFFTPSLVFIHRREKTAAELHQCVFLSHIPIFEERNWMRRRFFCFEWLLQCVWNHCKKA